MVPRQLPAGSHAPTTTSNCATATAARPPASQRKRGPRGREPGGTSRADAAACCLRCTVTALQDGSTPRAGCLASVMPDHAGTSLSSTPAEHACCANPRPPCRACRTCRGTSRCRVAVAVPCGSWCGSRSAKGVNNRASSVPSLLGIIIQNSPAIHHKLPVNLVVWSSGYVRALRAAGSGFDPRFRHSLRRSG